MKVLETQRLILRHCLKSDAQFIFDLLNDPSWIRWIGDRNIKTLTDAENFISSRLTSSYEDNGFGLYLVETKERGSSAGLCGLVKRDGLDHPDIGYAFLPQYRSQGFAAESAQSVLEYARDQLKFEYLLGITLPENTSSSRVLEKIGLKFERMILLATDRSENKLFSIKF